MSVRRQLGVAVVALGLAACAAGEPIEAGAEDAGERDLGGPDTFLPPPLGRPDAAPTRDFGRPRPRLDAEAAEDAATAVDAATSTDAAPALDAATTFDAAPADADVPPPDAAPPDAGRCAPEACNGRDDDCNGAVDEGPVCGPWVQAHCTLWMGWADDLRGPRATSAAWGACPAANFFQQGDVRCNSTRRDGTFRALDLDGNVDENDQLGFALRCDDAAEADQAAWVQSHCALFVGWADNRGGPPEGSAAWLGCPNGLQARQGSVACTSTGFDGNFRPMTLGGDVDDNDVLAFAWLCRDPADPDRAAALTAAVEVFAGWADDNRGPGEGAGVWGRCPPGPRFSLGGVACVGTLGDGAFHRMQLGGDVDGNDQLGFSLRAR